jgi:hypothetical protein
MEALNLILSALNLKDTEDSYNIIDSDDEFINYYNYRIKNEKSIKEQIDNFNKNINVSIDIFNLANGCEFSLEESINTLNYILSRQELMNTINHKSNKAIYENFKNIIETLFSRIIVIFLEKCNETNNIMEKCVYNVQICQYTIFYKKNFNTEINKTFENFYKSLTYRCFNIATNYGCIISWLTFTSLAPEMIKEHCYPIINKDTIIFKNIIWNNIKQNKLYEKELDLYYKYHQDS